MREARSFNRRAAAAFTITELVTTVAVCALLITLVGGAFSNVAQRRNSAMCLDNLRAMAIGVHMYNDMAGTLPGPVHPAIYRGVERDPNVIGEPGISPPLSRYFTFVMSNVLGDHYGDRLATCPTSNAVNPESSFTEFYAATGRRPYSVNYVLNNSGSSGTNDNSTRATNPPFYFGASAYISHPRYTPVRIGAIPNPDREWMIADAWYRKRASPTPDFVTEGSYPHTYTGEALLNYAPHFSSVRGVYVYSESRDAESARIRAAKADGLTNTAFFDGHAAAVPSRTATVNGFEVFYGFRGTVNPLAPPATLPVVWR